MQAVLPAVRPPLILGIASFFVPIPRHERDGLKAGDVDIGIEVRHKENVPPIVSTVLVVGGAGMMIAGGRWDKVLPEG